ncbi:DUF2510 domain-containing protein [Cellulomonas sp. URHD0024]|uniref:DUF2510 domain-containing protein n=1 Tax=Cellulomonas sp. URHD0024 TaxID=1302620 RepID=UPI000559690B|nr:DUF2510 domain-containing protein [Cellulomonas sp. URHD0024]
MSTSYGQPQPSVAAGWYADPQGGGHRWWDGAQWTAHTQPEAVHAPAAVVAPGYTQPGQVYPGLTGGGYPQAGGYQGFAPASAYPGAVTGYGFDQAAKPKNGLATWALIAGIMVVVVLLFLDYAIASGIAIIVGVRALRKARAIKAEGYPTAVGMGRAIAGLVLSGIGALLFLLSMFAG